MSRAELVRRPVWSPERDRNIKLAARHHEHVGRVVHDLIEGHEREAESHELDDRSQSNHGCADAESSETVLTNWRIDNTLRAKSFEQSLTHFIGAVVFRDFLPH